MAAKKKGEGLLGKLFRKARTKTTGSMANICWACSLNRCGQMFDNTCSCCRSHP